MRSTIVLLIFLIAMSKLYAQFSFETVIPAEDNIFLSYPIENENDYLLLGGSGTITDFSPTVAIVSKSGEIINQMVFNKQDTTAYFYHGFRKSNGNYIAIGYMSDTVTPLKKDFTYLCELTPDLQIVWDKYYRLPFASIYSDHDIKNFMLTPDSAIILNGSIDTLQYSYNRMLFLSEYNLNGEQLAFRSYDWWTEHSIGGGSTLILTSDSTGFFLIGNLDLNYFPKDWIRFDFDLNIESYGEMENQLSYFHSPATTKRLSNGNMIVANHTMGMGTLHDLEMRVMDEDFNLVRDTLLSHDEFVYIPDCQGMDFIDENNIWVSTFDWTFTHVPGTEVFRVFIFNSDLQVKGMKAYGDKTRYWFRNLLATTDGGCLITGEVPKFEGASTYDSYVIKIMPDDIITSAAETTNPYDSDYLVYPNPGSDQLNIQTARKGVEMELFDMNGRMVLHKTLSGEFRDRVTVTHLIPGFYTCRLTDKDGNVENKKWIKQ